jgi:hypothetical protein
MDPMENIVCGNPSVVALVFVAAEMSLTQVCHLPSSGWLLLLNWTIIMSQYSK